MLQENELRLFRENHKMEVKKLKDELDSVPKDQKKDAYRQLKEEKDIQQAERVSKQVCCYVCCRLLTCCCFFLTTKIPKILSPLAVVTIMGHFSLMKVLVSITIDKKHE